MLPLKTDVLRGSGATKINLGRHEQAKMRAKIFKMRPKMANMRLKMARMRPKLAKMRFKIAH